MSTIAKGLKRSPDEDGGDGQGASPPKSLRLASIESLEDDGERLGLDEDDDGDLLIAHEDFDEDDLLTAEDDDDNAIQPEKEKPPSNGIKSEEGIDISGVGDKASAEGGVSAASPIKQKSFLRVRSHLGGEIRADDENNVAGADVPEPPDRAAKEAKELDKELSMLKQEIKALRWLARRKEQEWDQIIRLLKVKEEQALRTERQHAVVTGKTAPSPIDQDDDVTEVPNGTGPSVLLNGTNTPNVVTITKTPSMATPGVPGGGAASRIVLRNSGPAGQQPQTRVILPKQPLRAAAQAPQGQQQQVRTILIPASLASNMSLVQGAAAAAGPGGQVRLMKLAAPPSGQPQQTTLQPILPAMPGASMTSVSSNNGIRTYSRPKIVSVQSNAPKPIAVQKPIVSPVVGKTSSTSATVRTAPVQKQLCQGCNDKTSEFVCAGCSRRWYCSRNCQVQDWDNHADDCD